MIKNQDTPVIYFAPMQEFSDWVYRSSHSKIFGEVTKYFAPYVCVQNDGSIKKSHLKDISPRNNEGYTLVPQILAGNAPDFITLANLLIDLGYQEINWNLGCPYPMVTNKGMGSGLLPHVHQIDRILSESMPSLSCKLSVKLRAGLNSSEELIPVMEVLNRFPLNEIILHPRIGKQLYNGKADLQIYLWALNESKHELIYNGDILTKEDYTDRKKVVPNQSGWMIGRGILKDPSLPLKLTKGFSTREKKLRFKDFHDSVFENYSKILSGKSHLLMRMLKFWSYFCSSFPDPHKTLKRIKKAGSMEKYNAAVAENFLILDEDEKNECCQDSGSSGDKL